MRILLILVAPVVTVVTVRALLIGIAYVADRIFRTRQNNDSAIGYWIQSFVSILIFLQAYTSAVTGVATGFGELSVSEWYIVYTILGVSSVLWCYFRWEFSIKTIPKPNTNQKQIAFKKICVFLLVMCFTIYSGYTGFVSKLQNDSSDALSVMLNLTVFTTLIALDRVLNQILVIRNMQTNDDRA